MFPLYPVDSNPLIRNYQKSSWGDWYCFWVRNKFLLKHSGASIKTPELSVLKRTCENYV
jgi:hypothetical protein